MDRISHQLVTSYSIERDVNDVQDSECSWIMSDKLKEGDWLIKVSSLVSDRYDSFSLAPIRR